MDRAQALREFQAYTKTNPPKNQFQIILNSTLERMIINGQLIYHGDGNFSIASLTPTPQ